MLDLLAKSHQSQPDNMFINESTNARPPAAHTLEQRVACLEAQFARLTTETATKTPSPVNPVLEEKAALEETKIALATPLPNVAVPTTAMEGTTFCQDLSGLAFPRPGLHQSSPVRKLVVDLMGILHRALNGCDMEISKLEKDINNLRPQILAACSDESLTKYQRLVVISELRREMHQRQDRVWVLIDDVDEIMEVMACNEFTAAAHDNATAANIEKLEAFAHHYRWWVPTRDQLPSFPKEMPREILHRDDRQRDEDLELLLQGPYRAILQADVKYKQLPYASRWPLDHVADICFHQLGEGPADMWVWIADIGDIRI